MFPQRLCTIAMATSALLLPLSHAGAWADMPKPPHGNPSFPPTDPVNVRVGQVSGMTCNKDNVSARIVDHNSSLEVSLGNLKAEAGGSVTRPVVTAGCDVRLYLEPPLGFCFEIPSGMLNAKLDIASGSGVFITSQFAMEGWPSTPVGIPAFVGPQQAVVSAPLAMSAPVGSTGGVQKAVVLNYRLKATRGVVGGHALVSMGSQDVPVAARYNLFWRKC